MPSQGQDQWRTRLEGLVPEGLSQQKVLLVGCGSVGSFMATELVRSGLRHITLLDPDTVEWPNLTRTVYGHADVGRPKVQALSDHLQGIFPDVQALLHPVALHDLGVGLMDLLASTDLVISAMDDPRANGLLDRCAYALGKPVVFTGLYRGAKGGEVLVTWPEITPCFHCSTGGVRKMAEETGLERVERSVRDYGTNRLVAEVALGADIHWVSAAAVKVALSLLACQLAAPVHAGSTQAHLSELQAGTPDFGQVQGRLAGFMARQLHEGCNYLILGMEPDYFLFPSTHAQAHGQYAFQSIWASTSRNDHCEVCGLPENREPPFPPQDVPGGQGL